MKLRALFLLAFLSFLISTNMITAQTNAPDSRESLKLPDNTFYFYFINGYALAYKFFHTEKSDFRIQLDLSSSYSDDDRNSENDNTYYLGKQSNNIKTTSSNNSITAAFAYSYNFYRSPLGQAFAGIGPFISYDRSKTESNTVNTYPNNIPTTSYNYSNTDLSYGFSAGLTTFLGVEAFLSKNFRVFAETQLSGGRNWSKNEGTSESNSSLDNNKSIYNSYSSSSSWYYNLRSVRIGLGISL